MRALGWLFAVLGVLALFGYGAVYLVLTTLLELQEAPVWLHGIGGAGAVLIGLWLFLDWGSLSELGKDQTVGRSFTSSVILLVGFALVVVINVVGYRYDKKWDVTANKQFTLSEQTLEVTRKLDREVEVLAFFMSGSPDESSFKELVDSYQDATTLIKVSYHDPFNDPILASKEGITSTYGTVIVRVGESEQRITSGFNEEALTNALVTATAAKKHSVCWVTGHGEGAADDPSSPEGLGVVFGKLEKQNYTVSPVNLLSEQPKPEACEAVVLAGPRAELLPSELDRLAEYVAAGGRLVVFLDALVANSTAADLGRYGVKVGNDVVIDQMRALADMGPTSLALDPNSYDGHPITEKLKGVVAFPVTRSVGAGPAIPGLTVTEIARASEASWGESNSLLDPTIPPMPDEGVEAVGRVPVAVAVEVTDPAAVPTQLAAKAQTVATAEGLAALAAPATPVESLPKKAGGRVVVIGSAAFATNQFASYGLNQDLALNSIGWSSGDESQITIRANENKKGKISIGVLDGAIAVLVSMFAVPGLALVGAVGTYMRRRSM